MEWYWEIDKYVNVIAKLLNIDNDTLNKPILWQILDWLTLYKVWGRVNFDLWTDFPGQDE